LNSDDTVTSCELTKDVGLHIYGLGSEVECRRVDRTALELERVVQMQSEAVRSIVLAHGEFFAGAIAAWVGDRDAPTTQVPPPGPEKLVVQFVVGDIYSIKGSDFGCENTLKAVDRLEKETPFGEVWGLHARIMRALERVQAGARGVIYGV